MIRSGFKIGSGYDVHALVPGRRLILGGVGIDFDKGLDGHSDADVLVHAVCDAILGAAGLGDIGEHFPDTDDTYKDISSLILLERCGRLAMDHGLAVSNMDCIIFAQAPKLSAFKRQMEKNIAGVLKIDASLVNVKATTTERLGFIGKEQGIAAQCTVLLAAVRE